MIALRAMASGETPPALERILARGRQLGVLGWIRLDGAQGLRVHAEGDPDAVERFLAALRADLGMTAVEREAARVEGHEQFAIRGVSAGIFVVQEHVRSARTEALAATPHFDLRLEVDGVLRSWALPKGPTMDPAVRRLAVEVGDHSLAHAGFEGVLGEGAVIVWDRGDYEQGGRVSWPEALRRGHAVFVLHGEKLRGGFALQRTRGGRTPQWLLIKRRDEAGRPGSDIVAERPESVLSGRTLDALLDQRVPRV